MGGTSTILLATFSEIAFLIKRVYDPSYTVFEKGLAGLETKGQTNGATRHPCPRHQTYPLLARSGIL
jgi:hypothetical protein